MAFEGHARYYTPALQVSESFISNTSQSGKQRSLYRYLFNWATSHWPTDWPVTHASDILPMFLHPTLSPKELDIANTMTDQLISFATQRLDRITWKEYKSDDRALNELNGMGEWSILNEENGAFDLNPEYVTFWRKVIDAVLGAGRHGWLEMGR